ncbi:hypothetical protein SHIRM173S_06762 [Streptomyces hirsutus]
MQIQDLPYPDPGVPDARSGPPIPAVALPESAPGPDQVPRLGLLHFASVASIPFCVGIGVQAAVDRSGGRLALAGGLMALACVGNAVGDTFLHRAAVTNWITAAARVQQLLARRTATLGSALTRRVAAGEVVAVSTGDVEKIGWFVEALSRFTAAVVTIVLVCVGLLVYQPALGVVVVVGLPLLALAVLPLLPHATRRADVQGKGRTATELASGLLLLPAVGQACGACAVAGTGRGRRRGTRPQGTRGGREALRGTCTTRRPVCSLRRAGSPPWCAGTRTRRDTWPNGSAGTPAHAPNTARNGSVLLGGVPLDELPLDTARGSVLVQDKDPVLLSGTLRALLDVPASGAVGTREALDAAQCGDVLAALVQGSLDAADPMDAQLTERGRSLSGGQRQRLSLARSLVTDPEVLVLDEPTSAVDSHTEARIAESLRELRAGRTTVVFTSSPLLLDRADQVVFLHDETVVAVGGHRELVRTEPRYRAVVTRETEAEAETGDRTGADDLSDLDKLVEIEETA